MGREVNMDLDATASAKADVPTCIIEVAPGECGIEPVPAVWKAALFFIRDRLNWVMWNIHQKTYSSPFDNTGNTFECSAFDVRGLDWSDEENPEKPWNFKWRNVRIGWYKHCQRSLNANIPLTPDMAQQCLTECIAALEAYEEAHRDPDVPF